MSGGYLESVLRLSRNCFSGIFMLTGQQLEGIWRMYACDLLTKTFFGLQIFDMYGMDRLGQYRSGLFMSGRNIYYPTFLDLKLLWIQNILGDQKIIWPEFL